MSAHTPLLPISLLLRLFGNAADGAGPCHLERHARIDDTVKQQRAIRRWNRSYAYTPAGTANADGYFIVTVAGRSHYAHRIAWAIHHGEDPGPDHEIHHIDGNRQNNSPDNLERLPVAAHRTRHREAAASQPRVPAAEQAPPPATAVFEPDPRTKAPSTRKSRNTALANRFEFTRFTATRGGGGKRATLTGATILSTEYDQPMSRGRAQRVFLAADAVDPADATASLTALGVMIEATPPCSFYTTGVILDDAVTDEHHGIAVVTADSKSPPNPFEITRRKSWLLPRPAIARSTKHILHPPHRRGVVCLDIDLGGAPSHIVALLATPDLVAETLRRAIPALAETGLGIRASSSAGLHNIRTGEIYKPVGYGWHVFLLTSDLSATSTLLGRLATLCQAARLGWHDISAAGSLLPRCPVDLALRSPNQPFFEAPTTLAHPDLGQHPRPFHVYPGAVMDPAAVAEPYPETVTTAEVVMAVSADEARRRAAPIRRAWLDAQAPALAARGNISVEEALANLVSRHACILAPGDLLQFHARHLGEVSVATVLAEPDRFIGQALASPLEGLSYRNNSQVAKVYRRDKTDRRVFISSKEHGGRTYELAGQNPFADTLRDFEAAIAALDALDAAGTAARQAIHQLGHRAFPAHIPAAPPQRQWFDGPAPAAASASPPASPSPPYPPPSSILLPRVPADYATPSGHPTLFASVAAAWPPLYDRRKVGRP